CCQQALIATAAVITTTIAITVIDATWNQLNPEPYHTSLLSGSGWIEELLNGHRDWMKDNLATRPPLFCCLEHNLIQKGELTGGKYINTKEQLAIFLY
ncbi:hypothetical protein BT96DRAFT_765019, partial [Gymnopus androsaceus JB14]